MSERQVSIAVDAIGGENSPFKTLKGSEYFHKNNICNLIPVCKKCHDNIHHGDLVVNKKVKTSDGIELDILMVNIQINGTHI